MNVTLPEIFFCACVTIVSTDSEACPLSYSVRTEVLLSGLSNQGFKLTTCHCQVLRLGMSGAIPLLAICAFMACIGTSLPLLFTFYILLYYQSINPLACTECGDSLPFSGASSIPPCHTLSPVTPVRRPFFHPPSLHPAIYFLVYLLVLLFPDSYTILFWESYFLPFPVHVQTNVIYAALPYCLCYSRFFNICINFFIS